MMAIKYINLDKVAYKFSGKPNSATLIFNHSSTEYLELDFDRELSEPEKAFEYYELEGDSGGKSD